MGKVQLLFVKPEAETQCYNEVIRHGSLLLCGLCNHDKFLRLQVTRGKSESLVLVPSYLLMGAP